MKYGKKYADSIKAFDRTKQYDAEEAIGIVLDNAKAKFDETIEFHCRLGVDPKQADQQVRGVIVTGFYRRDVIFRFGLFVVPLQKAFFGFGVIFYPPFGVPFVLFKIFDNALVAAKSLILFLAVFYSRNGVFVRSSVDRLADYVVQFKTFAVKPV